MYLYDNFQTVMSQKHCCWLHNAQHKKRHVGTDIKNMTPTTKLEKTTKQL